MSDIVPLQESLPIAKMATSQYKTANLIYGGVAKFLFLAFLHKNVRQVNNRSKQNKQYKLAPRGSMIGE